MPGTGKRIRVLIADDHPLYREGLARTIKERPELELVGEVADGRAAIDAIRELSPTVAVLDVKMPGLDGTDAAAAVTRDGLPTRVLLLSAYIDSPLVYRALGAGAAAYLSKEAGRAVICDAIVAVARGEVVIPPEIQAGLAEQIRLRADQDEHPVLTQREREVLRMTAEGCSSTVIGQRLFLSPATVKTHLQHLYEKLGVSDRAAAVAEGMRRGLLE